MSSVQQNAGEKIGEAQAKSEQWVDSAKDTVSEVHDKATNVAEKTSSEVHNKASEVHDKATDAATKTSNKTQHIKDENTNFLQQTGENVTFMAQGVVDGVKNTLGMGDEK